jgi:hypothetical protein
MNLSFFLHTLQLTVVSLTQKVFFTVAAIVIPQVSRYHDRIENNVTLEPIKFFENVNFK